MKVGELLLPNEQFISYINEVIMISVLYSEPTILRPFSLLLCDEWRSNKYQFYSHDFLDKGLLVTRKLLSQGFLVGKLKSSLRRFYSCHRNQYGPLLIHDLSLGL
jgi:hypothetical protein